MRLYIYDSYITISSTIYNVSYINSAESAQRSRVRRCSRAKGTAVRGRELYGRYHRLIVELAWLAAPGSDWSTELRSLLKQFKVDAANLECGRARSLREELCGQFKYDALQGAGPLARQILLAAVERLEQQE